MKVERVFLGLVFLALCGCDRLPSIESVMAGIPEDFTETGGDAKVTPTSDAGQKKSDRKSTLKFFQTPGMTDPFSGAELRLNHELVAGNPSYREFLLPKIILEARSPYRMGVAVNMGVSAKEIRTIVPAGGFYVGLLPSFDQKWVSEIGTGGAVNVDIRAEGRWSKLRSEDIICGGRFSASSPYHLPVKNLNPLLVSLVDARAEKLPRVGMAGRGGALLWLENIYYGFSSMGIGKGEDKIQSGWISLRPCDDVANSGKAGEVEMAILFASAAFRDGIPCWFAFAGDRIFLMFGALPPEKNSYVLSPAAFLDRGGGGDFYSVIEKSRQEYVDIVTQGTAINFLDVKERRFFYDFAPRQDIKNGPTDSKRGTSPAPVSSNPFGV